MFESISDVCKPWFVERTLQIVFVCVCFLADMQMAFIDGKFTFTDSEVSNQGSPCVGDTPWRQSF